MSNKPKANGGDGEVTKHHNVANRKQQLRDALRRTYEIDGEIQDLIAEHIQGLRDEKSDIKKRLREDLNITAKVFGARYGAYKLEADARAADDNATLDTLEELFNESPVGTQINMMDALGESQTTEHKVHEPESGSTA